MMRNIASSVVGELRNKLKDRPPWSDYAPFGRRILWTGIVLSIVSSISAVAFLTATTLFNTTTDGFTEFLSRFPSIEGFLNLLQAILGAFTLAIDVVLGVLALLLLLASTYFVRRVNNGDKIELNPLLSPLSPTHASVFKLLTSIAVFAITANFLIDDFFNLVDVILLMLFAGLLVGILLVSFGGIVSSVAELMGQRAERQTPEDLEKPSLVGCGRSELAVNEETIVIKKEASKTEFPSEIVTAVTTRCTAFGIDRSHLLLGIFTSVGVGALIGYFARGSDWLIVSAFASVLVILWMVYFYRTALKTKQIKIKTASGQTYSFATREEWDKIDDVTTQFVDGTVNRRRHTPGQLQRRK